MAVSMMNDLHHNSLLQKTGNAMVATSRRFEDSIFQPEITYFEILYINFSSVNARWQESE